jgi:hypothetical protein
MLDLLLGTIALVCLIQILRVRYKEIYGGKK